GTHNFIGNGIFAHNTYMGTAPTADGRSLGAADSRSAWSRRAALAATMFLTLMLPGHVTRTAQGPLGEMPPGAVKTLPSARHMIPKNISELSAPEILRIFQNIGSLEDFEIKRIVPLFHSPSDEIREIAITFFRKNAEKDKQYVDQEVLDEVFRLLDDANWKVQVEAIRSYRNIKPEYDHLSADKMQALLSHPQPMVRAEAAVLAQVVVPRVDNDYTARLNQEMRKLLSDSDSRVIAPAIAYFRIMSDASDSRQRGIELEEKISAFLRHANPLVRAEAIRFFIEKVKPGQNIFPEGLEETIEGRLSDDSDEVRAQAVQFFRQKAADSESSREEAEKIKELLTDESPAVQSHAIGFFTTIWGRTGTHEYVSSDLVTAIAGLLSNEDAKVQEEALFFLLSIARSPQNLRNSIDINYGFVFKQISEVLPDTSVKNQLSALMFLKPLIPEWSRFIDDALLGKIETLLSNENKEVRAEAISFFQVLLENAPERVRSAVIQEIAGLFSDKEMQVWLAAHAFFATVRQVNQGLIDDLVRGKTAGLSPEASSAEKIAAIQFFQGIMEQDFLQPYGENSKKISILLSDSDEDVRERAVLFFVSQAKTAAGFVYPARIKIAELLSDASPGVREAAIEFFHIVVQTYPEWVTDAVKGQIIGLLLDPDADVREQASIFSLTKEAGLLAEDFARPGHETMAKSAEKEEYIQGLFSTLVPMHPGLTGEVVLRIRGQMLEALWGEDGGASGNASGLAQSRLGLLTSIDPGSRDFVVREVVTHITNARNPLEEFERIAYPLADPGFVGIVLQVCEALLKQEQTQKDMTQNGWGFRRKVTVTATDILDRNPELASNSMLDLLSPLAIGMDQDVQRMFIQMLIRVHQSEVPGLNIPVRITDLAASPERESREWGLEMLRGFLRSDSASDVFNAVRDSSSKRIPYEAIKEIAEIQPTFADSVIVSLLIKGLGEDANEDDRSLCLFTLNDLLDQTNVPGLQSEHQSQMSEAAHNILRNKANSVTIRMTAALVLAKGIKGMDGKFMYYFTPDEFREEIQEGLMLEEDEMARWSGVILLEAVTLRGVPELQQPALTEVIESLWDESSKVSNEAETAILKIANQHPEGLTIERLAQIAAPIKRVAETDKGRVSEEDRRNAVVAAKVLERLLQETQDAQLAFRIRSVFDIKTDVSVPKTIPDGEAPAAETPVGGRSLGVLQNQAAILETERGWILGFFSDRSEVSDEEVAAFLKKERLPDNPFSRRTIKRQLGQSPIDQLMSHVFLNKQIPIAKLSSFFSHFVRTPFQSAGFREEKIDLAYIERMRETVKRAQGAIAAFAQDDTKILFAWNSDGAGETNNQTDFETQFEHHVLAAKGVDRALFDPGTEAGQRNMRHVQQIARQVNDELGPHFREMVDVLGRMEKLIQSTEDETFTGKSLGQAVNEERMFQVAALLFGITSWYNPEKAGYSPEEAGFPEFRQGEINQLTEFLKKAGPQGRTDFFNILIWRISAYFDSLEEDLAEQIAQLPKVFATEEDVLEFLKENDVTEPFLPSGEVLRDMWSRINQVIRTVKAPTQTIEGRSLGEALYDEAADPALLDKIVKGVASQYGQSLKLFQARRGLRLLASFYMHYDIDTLEAAAGDVKHLVKIIRQTGDKGKVIVHVRSTQEDLERVNKILAAIAKEDKSILAKIKKSAYPLQLPRVEEINRINKEASRAGRGSVMLFGLANIAALRQAQAAHKVRGDVKDMQKFQSIVNLENASAALLGQLPAGDPLLEQQLLTDLTGFGVSQVDDGEGGTYFIFDFAERISREYQSALEARQAA
ncbi:MAG: hypothetical protein HY586_02060, partial [Candidatus Omnitrophica bacterium]|nr:hypothetical protein [Candidatus Omnitrophota bacterium]